MKKILSIILVLFMALNIAGCSLLQGEKEDNTTTKQTKLESGAENETENSQQRSEEEYMAFLTERSNDLDKLTKIYKSQVDKLKKNPKAAKNKKWVAEVEKNATNMQYVYSTFMTQGSAPSKYKEADQNFEEAITLYISAAAMLDKACKENRSSNIKFSLDYYNKANKHMKEVQKQIK